MSNRNTNHLFSLKGLSFLAAWVFALAGGGSAAFGQGGPATFQVNVPYIEVTAWDAPTTSTTGTVLNGSVNATSWTVNYEIPAADITNLPDIRTLNLQYTEASGSDAVLKVEIWGPNQFGGISKEIVTFNSTSYYRTKCAFAPQEKIRIKILQASGLNNSDTFDINYWGFGLPESPIRKTDLLSLTINGVQQLDGNPNQVDLAAEFAQFNVNQCSWNPATFGEVTNDQVVQFRFTQVQDSITRPIPGTNTGATGTATAGVAP